jgi:Tol biopolymer transport system component
MDMRPRKLILNLQAAVLFLIILFSNTDLFAQEFGRNKVLYKNFDFRVTQTPHFEIYNYLQNNSIKNRFAQLTEQWYSMHQSVLRDTFKERNPLIVYNHHAEFQQTRAIEGQIDVGTGGVTEALKNRVILPFMESNAQTDHVLGHELVHAFQYHLIIDSLSLNALDNLPLWMVEGMAEYMSTGYLDANTAMWLRSAVANNKLPTLKDLSNRPDLYFPYRWGEAFWAYVTGLYGDTVIRKLFVESAKRGYADALKRVLHIDEKTFSKQWQEAIKSAYAPYQKNTQQTATGQSLITKKNAGELNIVPSISPDGKLIAFWTEKNLFSLDLYLADAATGKIIDRVTTNSFNSHIDQYSSYESSVAWSPDSRQLAFVAFAKGHNRLLIANSNNGKIKQEIDIPGVTGFTNPTWSPDGSTIVVTGLVNGQSDLYAYNLNTKSVKQLTNDIYSDFLPSYAPDGKWIAFATDRSALRNSTMVHAYAHNIALLNTQTGAVTNLDFFPGANNLNPVFGPDNKTIYFLSDRDGLRNLYSYNLDTKEILQRTNLFSGISGITMYAPAISVSQKTDQIVYSYYNNSDYIIYSAPGTAFLSQPVIATDVNMQAAIMPPFTRKSVDLVQKNIEHPLPLTAAQTKTTEVPYKPKFGLDYIGNTGVGIQTGGMYGTGLAGGVNGIFSDILGNHELFGAISLNGEIVDVAGQFAYLNQKHRFNWGASVSHVPYLSGAQYLFYDTLVTKQGDSLASLNSSLDLLRTFQDQVSLYAAYPFSTIRRIEAGASFARYYYRLDRYTDYYDPTGTIYYTSKKEKQPVPGGFNLAQVYAAFVGDNSSFGVAAPLQGSRYRFEVGQYAGVIRMSSLLGDYRKYFRFAPVTFATRNMFMGRYGRDAESGLLPPLFLGYPQLVRGYNALAYADNGSNNLSINNLIGSKIYVGNAELRYPLFGPERLSAIKSRFFLSDLNLFTDAGVAWGNAGIVSNPDLKNNSVNRTSRLIMSTGVSLRVNVFGYLILEPYYAIPWQNGGWNNRTFGVNVIPGW